MQITKGRVVGVQCITANNNAAVYRGRGLVEPGDDTLPPPLFLLSVFVKPPLLSPSPCSQCIPIEFQVHSSFQ